MVTIIAEKLIFSKADPKIYPGTGISEEIEITVHLKVSNSYSTDRVFSALFLYSSSGSGSNSAPFLRPESYKQTIIAGGANEVVLIYTARNMDNIYFNRYKENFPIQLDVIIRDTEGNNFESQLKSFINIEDNYSQENTGFKAWETLEEYYVGSGVATGMTKPNTPEDPDYVAPIYDPISCPLP